MTLKKPSLRSRFRLQGTDGIRREVRLSTNPSLKGMSPVQAFLDKGVMTDEFMELYVYAHVISLIRDRQLKRGDSCVVGWDPRDTQGKYTGAVVRGIRKAGINALVLGVVPTPLVPMFMLYKQAGGAFMVTASHNPKDQNGIKTFLAYRGMKLLPENDITLTRALLSLGSIRSKPLKGKRIDKRKEALDLFRRFSLDEENSWSRDVSFQDILLVVDPARGSLTGIAAEVFKKAGFGKVVEMNNRLNGDVNLRSGVADLEGYQTISRDMTVKRSGLFARHAAILKLFELGRKHKSQLRSGKLRLSGAVFDADGDRFYRLDYHPDKDCLLVLSGDETAYLQAEYLMKRDPEKYKGAVYINTVESDLNTSRAVERLGFKPQLSPVGDKWVLLRIVLLMIETRLKGLKGTKVAVLKKRLARLKQSESLDVSALQKLEAQIDQACIGDGGFRDFPFAVGSEETGHNITLGWMEGAQDERLPVFCGNGLKSALNTFAASQFLLGEKPVKKYYARLERPFTPGFKGTRYAYYIHQKKFSNGSAVWHHVRKCILKAGRERGYRGRVIPFREDKDMLYISLMSPKGAQAGVFVRNSGTENKISVNLRGAKGDASALKAIGEQAVRVLFAALKNQDNPHYKIELDLLSRIATQPLPEIQVTGSAQRVLMEMAKQKLVQPSVKGWRLTPLGSWYIKSASE
jgi:phosphoglucosamine mutase